MFTAPGTRREVHSSLCAYSSLLSSSASIQGAHSTTTHLAVTKTKLKAAAQGPMAARLSAPSLPTYPVSTRDRHGSMSTAPRVGRARAKISLSKTWGLETPWTAELSFCFARVLFRTRIAGDWPTLRCEEQTRQEGGRTREACDGSLSGAQHAIK